MGKYLMVVPSNALPGRDAEYNDWYENVHLAEVCALPGVTSGRRYEALETSPAKPDATYLAIYEIETEDPTAVLAEIGRRSRSGEMKPPSEALDRSRAKIMLFKQRA
jgi:hypothetical protein